MKSKQLIVSALCITELQYGEMVMDYANLWMERYFGTEKIIINALNHSTSFWKWWENAWNNRDTEFIRITGLSMIHGPLDVTERQLTKELYQDHHNVDDLRIVPNEYVVKEVGKLIKIEEQKLKELK